MKRILMLLTIVLSISACAVYTPVENVSTPGGEYYGPPDVVVMPDTDDVYFVPDINVNMYFWNGWWWRSDAGRWYRSQYYDRGWAYYNDVPIFYYDVDPGWRRYYRDHNWNGHRWNYERIPHQELQRNWNTWHNNRYWEREKTWGVQGYQPQPQQQREKLRYQRQQQYQQGPEIKQPQQWRKDEQNQDQQDQQLKLEQQRKDQQSQEKTEGENSEQIK